VKRLKRRAADCTLSRPLRLSKSSSQAAAKAAEACARAQRSCRRTLLPCGTQPKRVEKAAAASCGIQGAADEEAARAADLGDRRRKAEAEAAADSHP